MDSHIANHSTSKAPLHEHSPACHLACHLANLPTKLKTEIILYLENPSRLAKCSHNWYNVVNAPVTKSKWLIRRYGTTHALFHAIRIGEPFLNLRVVNCLLVQHAHLSRYFIQRLVAGFEKYNNKLVGLKVAHN